MRCRASIATAAGALLAFAGAAGAQATGGGSGGTGGNTGSGASRGQAGGAQTGRATGDTMIQQRTRTRLNTTQPGDSNRIGIGTPSAAPGGGGLTLPSGGGPELPPNNLGLNDPNFPNRDVNFSGLVRDGRLNADFIANLSPAERLELSRQLGVVDTTGDFGGGEVHMSQSRANRLMRERMAAQQRALEDRRRALGSMEEDYGDYESMDPNLAHALQRLELLEQRLIEDNERLLHRLGQARQMSGDRQARAVADVVQEMLLQQSEQLRFMGEMRHAMASQAGLPAGPAADARIGTRTFAAPERYGWEMEDRPDDNSGRSLRRNFEPYRGINYRPADMPDMYDEQGRRWR